MRSAGTRFQIAVFPLVDVVLFPGVTLPLQVHEAGNARMIREIQASRRSVAVSLVTPGEGEELILSPICGAGDLKDFREHPDGHQEVLVQGKSRVRLLSVVKQEPFLLMEAEALESENSLIEDMGEEDSAVMIDPGPQLLASDGMQLSRLQALVKTWAFLNPEFPDQYSGIFDEFTSFGELTDFFAFHFLKRAPEKQEYLNTCNPIRRAEMLSRFLEGEIFRLTRKLERAKKSFLLN